MARLIIHGGTPLKGSVTLRGAKNASFKLMIASLLSDQAIELNNICQIADVDLVKEIIVSLGGRIETKDHALTLKTKTLTAATVPEKLGLASRASSLFLAPLLARNKTCVVPLPGGDQIGNRPLDRHFEALRALGAEIEVDGRVIKAQCRQLIGGQYHFPKVSHTGTETMLMAAVLAQGKSVISNAALEPEVDDLINFLNQMGAKIKRLANRVIEINGVEKLLPTTYSVMPDRNEAVSYAVAGLVTQGEVTVKNVRQPDIAAFLDRLTVAGGGYEFNGDNARFYYSQPLQAVNVTTAPHPGFMTDWQPLWSVLATQCHGQSIITETIFPNRFQFLDSLKKMGAKSEFLAAPPGMDYNFNPEADRPDYYHRCRIFGPTALSGQELRVTDIRAGATLALAGLCAQGQTILQNISHLDRGYEDFSGRLQALGAKIERVD